MPKLLGLLRRNESIGELPTTDFMASRKVPELREKDLVRSHPNSAACIVDSDHSAVAGDGSAIEQVQKTIIPGFFEYLGKRSQADSNVQRLAGTQGGHYERASILCVCKYGR